VIEAVQVLVRNGADVRLDVYGTGSALPGRAELAGRPAAADVAFTPGAAETFGRSVLEALACGTPVVSADTETVAWPVAARRAAARGQTERFPWSATVDSMLRLHATAADGDVAPTGRNEVG
jgi:alpha-1,6-mannosyltransferase